MKLRLAIFVLCFATATGLAALIGAMEHCGTLAQCLATEDGWLPAATRPAPEMTPEEALQIDDILTAMIAG